MSDSRAERRDWQRRPLGALGLAVATTAGWLAGVAVGWCVGVVVALSVEGPWGTLAAPLAATLVFGAVQAIALRGEVSASRWIATTSVSATAGWLAGSALAWMLMRAGMPHSFFVHGACIGVAMGAAQQAVRAPNGHGSRWIAANAIGWSLALGGFVHGPVGIVRILAVAAPGCALLAALLSERASAARPAQAKVAR